MAGAFEDRRTDNTRKSSGTANTLSKVAKFLRGQGDNEMTPEEARRKISKKKNGITSWPGRYISFLQGLFD